MKRTFRNYRPLEVFFIHAVFLAPLIIVLTISFLSSAEQMEKRQGFFAFTPKCVYKELTGKPCMTCGMSRGFACMSHGEFERAKAYNGAVYFWYFGFWVATLFLLGSYARYLLGQYATNEQTTNETIQAKGTT